jgi:hypothetical protein
MMPQRLQVTENAQEHAGAETNHVPATTLYHLSPTEAIHSMLNLFDRKRQHSKASIRFILIKIALTFHSFAEEPSRNDSEASRDDSTSGQALKPDLHSKKPSFRQLATRTSDSSDLSDTIDNFDEDAPRKHGKKRTREETNPCDIQSDEPSKPGRRVTGA